MVPIWPAGAGQRTIAGQTVTPVYDGAVSSAVVHIADEMAASSEPMGAFVRCAVPGPPLEVDPRPGDEALASPPVEPVEPVLGAVLPVVGPVVPVLGVVPVELPPVVPVEEAPVPGVVPVCGVVPVELLPGLVPVPVTGVVPVPGDVVPVPGDVVLPVDPPPEAAV